MRHLQMRGRANLTNACHLFGCTRRPEGSLALCPLSLVHARARISSLCTVAIKALCVVDYETARTRRHRGSSGWLPGVLDGLCPDLLRTTEKLECPQANATTIRYFRDLESEPPAATGLRVATASMLRECLAPCRGTISSEVAPLGPRAMTR